jgi:hypothetical protein
MTPVEKLRHLLESKGIYKEAIALMKEHNARRNFDANIGRVSKNLGFDGRGAKGRHPDNSNDDDIGLGRRVAKSDSTSVLRQFNDLNKKPISEVDMMGQEKVYKERANGQWEYWTYSDGERYYITAKQAEIMIRQGAKLITLK